MAIQRPRFFAACVVIALAAAPTLFYSPVRTLAVESGLSADFDGNGSVNYLDLNKWEADFGVSAESDADDDGTSGGFDFLAWQIQSGSSMDVPQVISQTPEPAALVVWGGLASIGGLLYAWRRRRS